MNDPSYDERASAWIDSHSSVAAIDWNGWLSSSIIEAGSVIVEVFIVATLVRVYLKYKEEAKYKKLNEQAFSSMINGLYYLDSLLFRLATRRIKIDGIDQNKILKELSDNTNSVNSYIAGAATVLDDHTMKRHARLSDVFNEAELVVIDYFRNPEAHQFGHAPDEPLKIFEDALVKVDRSIQQMGGFGGSLSFLQAETKMFG